MGNLGVVIGRHSSSFSSAMEDWREGDEGRSREIEDGVATAFPFRSSRPPARLECSPKSRFRYTIPTSADRADRGRKMSRVLCSIMMLQHTAILHPLPLFDDISLVGMVHLSYEQI